MDPRYNLRAEARSVESDHRVWRRDDGRYEALSETRPGKRHVMAVHLEVRPVRFTCTCEAGEYQAREQTPCWATAKLARRLEREGVVRWDRGVWRAVSDTPSTPSAPPEDPFEGLVQERVA